VPKLDTKLECSTQSSRTLSIWDENEQRSPDRMQFSQHQPGELGELVDGKVVVTLALESSAGSAILTGADCTHGDEEVELEWSGFQRGTSIIDFIAIPALFPSHIYTSHRPIRLITMLITSPSSLSNNIVLGGT
jgi:hypothetical protein